MKSIKYCSKYLPKIILPANGNDMSHCKVQKSNWFWISGRVAKYQKKLCHENGGVTNIYLLTLRAFVHFKELLALKSHNILVRQKTRQKATAFKGHYKFCHAWLKISHILLVFLGKSSTKSLFSGSSLDVQMSYVDK